MLKPEAFYKAAEFFVKTASATYHANIPTQASNRLCKYYNHYLTYLLQVLWSA